MDNRRRSHRWLIGRWANLTTGSGETLRCRVEDMSVQGLRLFSTQPLPQDAGSSFSLDISGDLSIDFRMNVPWEVQKTEGHLSGVRFSKISDRDKDEIFGYVSNHFPDQVRARWWAGC